MRWGDKEKASAALKEGIEKTDSQKLKDLLDSLNKSNVSENESSADSTSSKLKFARTQWGVEDDNGTLAIKDELTLDDSSITYSDNDIANKMTASVGKEIVAQIKAEKASVEKYGEYYE